MQKPSPERIRGLDAIRCVLACWVTVSHLKLPELPFDRSTPLGWLVTAAWHRIVSGPAAVIAFFVISGFCIHLPYRNDPPTSWGRYYIRRYVRILVPLVVAITIAKQLELPFGYFSGSILWSIICEEIYYAVYPGLRWFRSAIGWPMLLTISFAASWLVAGFCDNTNYQSPGWQLTWILGLPCWLLGCLLAEQSDGLWASISWRTVWSCRLAVWAASCICLILRFHTPIRYGWTLNLFAVLVFFWLSVEIRYYRSRTPWSILEWAGRWSYSLYLFHMLAISIYSWGELPAAWPLKFTFALASSYVFFLVVEKPSHAVARRLGRDRTKATATLLDSQFSGPSTCPSR